MLLKLQVSDPLRSSDLSYFLLSYLNMNSLELIHSVYQQIVWMSPSPDQTPLKYAYTHPLLWTETCNSLKMLDNTTPNGPLGNVL